MNDPTEREHFVELDFLPPPCLGKAWDRMADEISVDESKAEEYRDALCGWLDSQCGQEWRRKVLVIDLVLPNPLDDFKTVTGLLLGVKDASDCILKRHEQCVLDLKVKKSSVGLHPVFLKGIPLLKNQTTIATSKALLAPELACHAQEDIERQHLLYGSLGRSQSAKSGHQSSNASFVLKAIAYSPSLGEEGDPLAGDENASLEDNWNTYLAVAHQRMPEVASVVGIPLATPSSPDDLAAEFHRIGQVFLCFNVEARIDGVWDEDCSKLIRSLCLFAAYANASHSGAQLRSVRSRQHESHEIGKVFNTLRSKLIRYLSPDGGEGACANALVRKSLLEVTVDHMELWAGDGVADRASLLSTPWLALCLTVEDLIRACWEHSVDFYATTPPNKVDGLLPPVAGDDPFPERFQSWRTPLLGALEIDPVGGLHLARIPRNESASAVKIVSFVKILCAIMRDVLKHAEPALRQGGKTNWRIAMSNHAPDQLIPRAHRVIILTQTNPGVSQRASPSSGMTDHVIQMALDVGNEFSREDTGQLHEDILHIRNGAMYQCLLKASISTPL